MFALAVRYLTGRAVATDPAWRDAPEWPPHPARLFFALVDALHTEGNQPIEREAIEWLAKQAAPELVHSEKCDRILDVFVPVNDTSLADLTEVVSGNAPRSRQPRTFPSVTPDDPNVYFIWREADPSQPINDALAIIASRVARLGHSSSLVAVRVCDNPPSARLIPHLAGEVHLRVFDESTLESVENAFEVSVEMGQRGVLPVRFLSYRDLKGVPSRISTPPRGVFAEMFAFKAIGPRLPIVAAPLVAQAMRTASISQAHDPVPEVLSGHRANGAPSVRPHVAFAALPYVADAQVGPKYADGHLLGVVVMLPQGIDGADRLSILRAIGAVEELRLGRMGEWRLERMPPDPPLHGLRQHTWTHPSVHWASATPIVLDRFPKNPYGSEAADIIASSCERIGLPRPVAKAGRFSALLGVPPSDAFDALAKRGMPPRFHVHADLIFPTPVRGPVLIGAGRYRGFGLCRPVRAPNIGR